MRKNEWNGLRALRGSAFLMAKIAGMVSVNLLEVRRWLAIPGGRGSALRLRFLEPGGEGLIKKVRALLRQAEFSSRGGNCGRAALEASCPAVPGEEPPVGAAAARGLESPRLPRARLSDPERRDVERLTRRLDRLRFLLPEVGKNIQLSEQVLGWIGDRPSGFGAPQPRQEEGAVPLLGY
ncbi:MAG: hypothetical protein HY717_06640 [Planctomycetes bacterium]|nr:hypothetical protein [Planctomycetota bacterium]